jgi:hypothetical protein
MIQNVHLPCLYDEQFCGQSVQKPLNPQGQPSVTRQGTCFITLETISQGCKQFFSTVFNTLQRQLTASQEIYHEISL